jgi:nicotinate-nucleotide--dimethylbenzimidazole phosphoribosyltransferase
LQERTLILPTLAASVVIQPGMNLPLPDDETAERAEVRLRGLDVAGSGFGAALTSVVRFAAGAQRQTVPRPWQTVRVLLVHGDHAGGAAAGDSPAEAARRARDAFAGESGLGALIAETGAGLQLVAAPAARPIETEDALTAVEVDEALTYGWRLAEQAADSGVDLIVIAACGAGAETAAAATTAALTRGEPVALLGRVHAADGRYDDSSWMVRCTAVRDALHRTRARPRNAHDLLAALGGGDIAVVTGVLLGAAARRTPVLLDGPVGVVAGLVSRDIAGQARHWCLLADDGGDPTVRYASEVLGLRPVLDLRFGLGEGTRGLAALPLLRAALALAGSMRTHPRLRADEPEADEAATTTDTATTTADTATTAADEPAEEGLAAEDAAGVEPAATGRTG